MSLKNLSICLLVFFIITGFLNNGCTQDQKQAPPEKPKDTQITLIKAEDFTLNDIDGKPVKLSTFIGKVIILDFWATWCPPCVMEIPHFNELSEQYKDSGLVVLGVSVDKDGATAVKKFKENKPINYLIMIGQENIYKTYQSYLPENKRGGIPFTFIIDKKGFIRHYYVGYREKAVFEEAIKKLITE